jgi:hypothetical protein
LKLVQEALREGCVVDVGDVCDGKMVHEKKPVIPDSIRDPWWR